MIDIAETYDVSGFLRNAAGSVADAQRKFDESVSLDYLSQCPTPATSLVYAIPRALFRLRFGFRLEQGKLKLIPFGGNEITTRYVHDLSFAVIAEPNAPSPLVRSEDGVMRLVFEEPGFLVRPEDEFLQGEKLRDILADKAATNWQIVLSDGSVVEKPNAAQKKRILDEAVAIQEELNKPLRDRRFMAFRLRKGPLLLIRLTDKEKNDGVFLLKEDTSPSVQIYSFEGDDSSKVNYAPLHEFALTLRDWQRRKSPLQRLDFSEKLPPSLESLAGIANQIREGYTDAIDLLAGLPDDTITFYDLVDVAMTVRYSVRYGGGERVSVNFVDRQSTAGTADSAADFNVIESIVTLNVKRSDNIVRLEVKLVSPEFTLSGEARKEFVAHAADPGGPSFPKIVEKLEQNDPGVPYRQFVLDETLHPQVVVLLSYKDDKPREEFLVIWPALFLNERRDFAFTCKRNNGNLEQIKPILMWSQGLSDAELDTAPSKPAPAESEFAESTLAGDAYRAFHNFFHAVSIWRRRMSETVTAG
jgi:hypothetical protein